jgi:hypothetical protein
MERRQIPREIILEPKVFGPFTWKKLGYLAGGGVIFYLGVFAFPFPLLMRIVLGIITAVLTLCLIFLEPYGRPFEEFILIYLIYLFRPRRKVWSKTAKKDLIEVPAPPYSVMIRWYGKPILIEQALSVERVKKMNVSMRKARRDVVTIGKL